MRNRNQTHPPDRSRQPSPGAPTPALGSHLALKPQPARKPVAQASLPAILDSSSTPARTQPRRHGGRRHDRPANNRSRPCCKRTAAPPSAPQPARKTVAQASLPAILDSASTPARTQPRRHGGRRHARPASLVAAIRRQAPARPQVHSSCHRLRTTPAVGSDLVSAPHEPLPARKTVAQASLPAIPDSSRYPARTQSRRHGGRRHDRPAGLVAAIRRQAPARPQAHSSCPPLCTTPAVGSDLMPAPLEPRAARKTVAQASLPAIPDSSSTPARTQPRRHGGRRHDRPASLVAPVRRKASPLSGAPAHAH